MITALFLIACSTETPAAKPDAGAHTETAAKPEAKKDGHGHGHDHDHDGADALLPVPEGAKVMFGALENGATVSSPVKVMMKVEGMTVEPAGKLNKGKGHHHLIIDDKAPAAGTAVAKDATHIHFGKGQTEAEVELTPGEHTLTLQFADGVHRSYGPQMATSITITVK